VADDLTVAIPNTELEARARRVRLLLLDVDGVLTDGRILLDDRGGEAKAFSIRDGPRSSGPGAKASRLDS
jgi:3-deoxy-D-manno-octulosonate 8-phosphate phosphatase (KDO 8-P phosphatase)